MFRPFSPTPPSWHLRRVRTLSLEHLESRVVLSGVPEAAVTLPSIDAALPTDPSALIATTSIVVTGDLGTVTPPLTAAVDSTVSSVGGLPPTATHVPDMLPSLPPAACTDNTPLGTDIREQTVGATVSTLAQSMSPPGSGGAPGIPPWVTDLSANLIDGVWRIRGTVLDDSSTAGLTVYFGGILNTQTTTDEFGNFELVIADRDLGVGWVYIHTVDVSGMTSDYEKLTIDR